MEGTIRIESSKRSGAFENAQLKNAGLRVIRLLINEGVEIVILLLPLCTGRDPRDQVW